MDALFVQELTTSLFYRLLRLRLVYTQDVQVHLVGASELAGETNFEPLNVISWSSSRWVFENVHCQRIVIATCGDGIAYFSVSPAMFLDRRCGLTKTDLGLEQYQVRLILPINLSSWVLCERRFRLFMALLFAFHVLSWASF